MPTRRQNPEHSVFRPEAFASSPDFDRGVPGNLVAARCRQLTDPEEIAMLWWLQQISWRQGGLIAFAAQIAEKNRSQIWTTETMYEGGGELPETRAIPVPISGDICTAGFSEFLARATVDPAAKSLRLGTSGSYDCRVHFNDLWGALVALRKAEIEAARKEIVETAVSARVFEALDFVRESRSFVLIEGREGLGKSEAARNWCRRHPGEAVYVSLQSGTDEMTLFRCIAQAVGTACAITRKAGEIKANVEKALQPGHLTLVLDEAHFLWPQSGRAERSAPKRVDWLRTALIDSGVSVAIVSTPQYFGNQCDRFRRGGWNANQIQRRLAHIERLPETLSLPDMRAVISLHFPQIAKTQSLDVAILATSSMGFVGAIAHLHKRLEFLTRRKGARTEAETLDRLIADLAAEAGIDLAALKAGAAKKTAPAPAMQTPGSRAAVPMPRRCTAPANLSRISSEQPMLSVI
jgi:hypothetical protein